MDFAKALFSPQIKNEKNKVPRKEMTYLCKITQLLGSIIDKT